MPESLSIERQLVAVLAYILEEGDKSTFIECIKDRFDAHELLNLHSDQQVLPLLDNLTPPQKFLFGFLAHLYGAFASKIFFTDTKLRNIRSRLSLSDDFAVFAFNRMQRVNPNSLLKGRQPIECILNPDANTSRWILDLVYNAAHDGMFITKQELSDLSPMDYEHPSDKIALDALERTPGLELVGKKIVELQVEYSLRLNYMGSNMQVTPSNFPHINKALVTVCKTLNVPIIPELYFEFGAINAFTVGAENPIIVLYSGIISLFDYDELLFALGHEVGHIKSKHVLYQTMAQIIRQAGDIVGQATLGLGKLISGGLNLAIMSWSRKSELTADRAGLLACQNPDAAITAMMKIAGAPPKYYRALNKDEFLKQAKKFEGLDIDNLNKIAKTILIMDRNHPWTVYRALELKKWIDSGDYRKIIDQRKQARPSIEFAQPDSIATQARRFCTKCGKPFEEDHQFCTVCGSQR